MEYFTKYNSNTLAGSGNQHFFMNEDGTKTTKSCCLYKIFAEGSYSYSFLFSNIIDSTYSDGAVSHKNLIVDSWVVEEMNVGVSSCCSEKSFDYPKEMQPVLFSGNRQKTVNPGEIFSSDPVELTVNSGEYICLEIVFSGKMIPYHEESIIPSFVYRDGRWTASKLHPFASMVGADRAAKKKIAFLGDSITQGIGTPINSYSHWNAVFAEKLGKEYSYWNLGLGYGRADDAASDGAWLYKAKQNDIVFVCYGVNDIFRGFSAAEIKKNLQIIADKLSRSGACVIFQTVPPFDYPPEHQGTWNDVNNFILHELKNTTYVFDCVDCLKDSDSMPYKAKYGGHPNSEGCKIWGEALFESVMSAGIID